jgi:ketosteroid isomerase-like protein
MIGRDAMDGKIVERSSDAAGVRAVIDAVIAGFRARDAAAVGRCFTSNATVADLAPPLVHRGFDVGRTQRWIDGWEGPIELSHRDLTVEVAGGLAVVHGLEHTSTQAPGGEVAAWWARVTTVLARTPEGWRITHLHSSVPFHMDGSERAALDLEP